MKSIVFINSADPKTFAVVSGQRGNYNVLFQRNRVIMSCSNGIKTMDKVRGMMKALEFVQE